MTGCRNIELQWGREGVRDFLRAKSEHEDDVADECVGSAVFEEMAEPGEAELLKLDEPRSNFAGR